MNILLTSAGRRNYLLDYFRRALHGSGRVLAADCSAYAAALQEADEAFIVPRVSDPEYIDHLLSLCLDQDVALLLSLNDHELPILADARDRFMAQGTQVVVSRSSLIELAADKWATAHFLTGAGFETAVTYASLEEALSGLAKGDVDFPLIVKPRRGTASLGIEWVEDEEELRLAWALGLRRLPRLGLAGNTPGSGLIVQNRLPGDEYGLDIINDLTGRYRTTFVKRKLGMRGGETDKAMTEMRPELVALGARLGEVLGHIGNLDCDIFFDDGRCYVLELNPRFGGGYPFSAMAGADVPAALIAWARGEEPAADWNCIQSGIIASKCDRLVGFGRLPSSSHVPLAILAGCVPNGAGALVAAREM